MSLRNLDLHANDIGMIEAQFDRKEHLRGITLFRTDFAALQHSHLMRRDWRSIRNMHRSKLRSGLFLVALATLANPAIAETRKVAVLLFDGVEIIDYTGPYEILGGAGYEVFTVAAKQRPIETYLGMKTVPTYTFDNAPQADIVVVPGGDVSGARTDIATLQWLKKQTLHAQHTMSVCNGAFILANAGLLDGLTATTTYGLIPQLRSQFPKVKVVSDQRFVDNGKIITTAGLSAGIDGALHLVEVMDGEAAAELNALGIEYDWHSRGGVVRGLLADKFVPKVDLSALGAASLQSTRGDREHWEVRTLVETSKPPAEVLAFAKKAYANAYKLLTKKHDALRIAPTGNPMSEKWQFTDDEGRTWVGTLSLILKPSQPQSMSLDYAIYRIA